MEKRYSLDDKISEKKYSLKQKVARTATVGGLALIALTTPGCSTLGDFAKSQAEPYVVYSKEGVIDEETGKIKFALPYWQTKPIASTLKVAIHAAVIGGIAYGIKKYCDSQRSDPEPTPEPVDDDDPIQDGD